MTIGELRNKFAELEANGVSDTLVIKVFDEDNRLRDFDVTLEIGGIDDKDKYYQNGNPILIAYGIVG